MSIFEIIILTIIYIGSIPVGDTFLWILYDSHHKEFFKKIRWIIFVPVINTFWFFGGIIYSFYYAYKVIKSYRKGVWIGDSIEEGNGE